MQFISKVGDVIVLEEDSLYQVLHCIEMQGRGFLVIRKAKMSLESVLQLKSQEVEIVEEVVDNKFNYYFQNVKDPAIISAIQEKIKELE